MPSGVSYVTSTGRSPYPTSTWGSPRATPIPSAFASASFFVQQARKRRLLIAGGTRSHPRRSESVKCSSTNASAAGTPLNCSTSTPTGRELSATRARPPLWDRLNSRSMSSSRGLFDEASLMIGTRSGSTSSLRPRSHRRAWWLASRRCRSKLGAGWSTEVRSVAGNAESRPTRAYRSRSMDQTSTSASRRWSTRRTTLRATGAPSPLVPLVGAMR